MNKGYQFYCMVKILLFLIIGNAFPVLSLSGLEMSVSGFVRDFDSNTPIPGIEVAIFKVESGVSENVFRGTSDRNGFYKVRYLSEGNYRFSVTMPTIGTIHIGTITSNGKNYSHLYELQISEGQNIRLDIIMGENPYPSLERNISSDGSMITFVMKFPKTKLFNKAMSRNLLESPKKFNNDMHVSYYIKYKYFGESLISNDNRHGHHSYYLLYSPKGTIYYFNTVRKKFRISEVALFGSCKRGQSLWAEAHPVQKKMKT